MALALLTAILIIAAATGFGAYHLAKAITRRITVSSVTCFAVTSLTGILVTMAVEAAAVL